MLHDHTFNSNPQKNQLVVVEGKIIYVRDIIIIQVVFSTNLSEKYLISQKVIHLNMKFTDIPPLY
tara:strand:+ start:179 stop:373 length:195 start_codon:yes stop_codon:yes gene_type:complete